MVGRLLLEWRTQQALEFENRNRQFTKEEIFEDNQMVSLLALHSSALQTSTMKFRQDFIGPLFIDTVLDQSAIGRYLPCEPHQERFSAHTTGHSKYF